MPLPQIAIVGRPNVGKSSLLNRLARRRVSIVDPTPGVTRDRVSVVIEVDPPAEWPGDPAPRYAELVDTGGYGVYTADGKRYDDAGADLSMLTDDIESQIHVAREQAEVILFVIDAQVGLTALDEQIARLLRESGSGDKVIAVANKVDGESWEAHGLEVATLALGAGICVSASNGYGIRGLLAALYEAIEGLPPAETTEPELRLAIVGKRNAGKSTLINALAGEDRVIVSEIAGTTRDSVDVRFEVEGRSLIAIDTAGVRKRKSFADDVEYYAYHRMLQAIRRADVVALLVDATEEISQVDKKLTQELQRQFKPTVIVVNKCDRLAETSVTPEDYHQYLLEQLRGLDFAPVVFISAHEGDGLRDVVALAFNVHAQASHRVGTGELNRLLKAIFAARGPSPRLGLEAKLYYANQVDVCPPTIVCMVNRPDLFSAGYQRYLMNRLREELPFSEVPIRLVFSARERMSVGEMKHRGKTRESG
ncbi:MAG: ribosome biogenesis GTPase Der [Phycisphaerales bacterium]|nr:ribosome biogenesis GTPase Der [Phycisphaerae bacterium]NNF43134.1 ribosome biogenesis GTPase Der [Phycisphaerales bacterium]NNM24640.1 ribosome biogenesis GTPase Der [Phycisphaerales bacterium]